MKITQVQALEKIAAKIRLDISPRSPILENNPRYVFEPCTNEAERFKLTSFAEPLSPVSVPLNSPRQVEMFIPEKSNVPVILKCFSRETGSCITLIKPCAEVIASGLSLSEPSLTLTVNDFVF